MVLLYKGEYCVYPKKDQIVSARPDDNWMELVKAAGMTPERYYKVAFDGRHSYYDFGSWSYFVVKCD